MTVTELMQKLQSAYSLFTPKIAEVWTPIYRAALSRHEGPGLARAYSEVMQSFEPSPRKAYPSPKDFALALPASHPKIRDEGTKLDFKARGERARSLLSEWRREQAHRGANGHIEVLRALEAIAEPLANLHAWKDSPEPLRLTKGQLRLGQQRAISQERVRRYGPLPRDAATWWEQISAIAHAWGIAVAYEEWGRAEQRAAA